MKGQGLGAIPPEWVLSLPLKVYGPTFVLGHGVGLILQLELFQPIFPALLLVIAWQGPKQSLLQARIRGESPGGWARP